MTGKLVALKRERRSDNWRQEDYFIAAETVGQPEVALRETVREYLHTPGGQECIADTDDFNWGDAIMSVPDDMWEKHGMRMVKGNRVYSVTGEAIEVLVSQDEDLIEDEHYKEEE